MVMRGPERPDEAVPHWRRFGGNFHGEIALANGTQWMFDLAWRKETLWVAIEGKGYAAFGGPPEILEVMDALGVKNKVDARNVTDLICAQFGENTDYGRYEPALCAGSKTTTGGIDV